MPDENALRRWFSLEMGKMLETFVPVPRYLADLLREAKPTAPTRGGEPHEFDPDALRRLAAALPALTRSQLRLPITFHLENETPGDAYVADTAAADALVSLGVGKGSIRDGRLWVSAPLARLFAKDYPTLVQFVPH